MRCLLSTGEAEVQRPRQGRLPTTARVFKRNESYEQPRRSFPPPNLDSSALAPLTTRLATLQDAACRETLQASSRGQMIMSDASGYLGEGLG